MIRSMQPMDFAQATDRSWAKRPIFYEQARFFFELKVKCK